MKRIEIIDSFRSIAVIGVLLYHFTSRWDNTLISKFGIDFFHNGFLGVSFFFMISGFVISYSLERTNTIKRFWQKRMIRLFPSLFIASTITFIFVLLFDKSDIFPKSHLLRNYFTSLTFLPPAIFNNLFLKKLHFSYLNFSYWSLWPEIQFYLFISLLYFFNKLNFIKNYIVISVFLIAFYKIYFVLGYSIFTIDKFINLFNLIRYLPFFLAGSLFYQLYKFKEDSLRFINSYNIIILSTYILLLTSFNLNLIFLYSLMYILFYLFIYYPEKLKFLKNKIIIDIGISSYFLYLIHEYIGVIILKRITGLFEFNLIVIISLIVIMCIFSFIYSKFIETKISKFLLSKI